MENGHETDPQLSLTTFGSPIANSTRSLLTPRPGSRSSNHSLISESSASSKRPLVNRLKGQDLYGGPVTFGGGNASSFFRRRRDRLMAASPYQQSSSLRRNHNNNNDNSFLKNAQSPPKSSTEASESSSAVSYPPSDAMSSTAKLILDTLERMSTPLRDARKIPLPAPDSSRAEKRRLIAEELDGSLLSAQKRKRPNLSSGGASLSGPPARTIFSPVLNKKKAESQGNAKSKWLDDKPEEKKTPSTSAPSLSVASSCIDVFKQTVDSSTHYGSSTTVGGKLRTKDKLATRSKRSVESPYSSTSSAPFKSNFFCAALSGDTTQSASSSSSSASIAPSFGPRVPSDSSSMKSATPTMIPSSTRSSSCESEAPSEFIFSNPAPSSVNFDEKTFDDEKKYNFTFSSPRIVEESSSTLVNGHGSLPDLAFSASSCNKFPNILGAPSSESGSKLPDVAATPQGLKQGNLFSSTKKINDESVNKRLAWLH